MFLIRNTRQDARLTRDAAMSTFCYVDDGSDVPDDLAVFPGDNSPKHLKHLSDILTAYASDKGYGYIKIGDEQ